MFCIISCNSDELKIVRAGQGSPGEDCGKELLKFCFHCNDFFYGRHYCMRRDCPNCYNRWAWREAQPATEKILYNRRGRNIVHGVVSFEGKPSQILEFRRNCYDILKEHGILSGIVIPHHERHGKVDGYLHYHFLGYIRNNSRYIPGGPGEYIFKVIRWLNRAREIAPVIHYFLTHCAIVNGRHSVTYYGEKFRKPKQKQKNLDDYCPKCHNFTARSVPIIDYNGCYVVEVYNGCSVEGGG